MKLAYMYYLRTNKMTEWAILVFLMQSLVSGSYNTVIFVITNNIMQVAFRVGVYSA